MTTLTPAQIAAVAYGAGFRGSALTISVAVALAESSGRSDVINSIGCVGLWQINQPVHTQWTAAQLQSPQTNAAAAYSISSGGTNWRPWETFTNGMYAAEMGQATMAVAQIGKTDPSSVDTTVSNTTADQAGILNDLGNQILPGLGTLIPALPSLGNLFGGGGSSSSGTDGGTGVLGGLEGITRSMYSALTLAIRGAAWVSDPHNWVRVIEVGGGVVALFIGLRMLAGTDAGGPVADAVRGTVRATGKATHAVTSTAKTAAEAAVVA